MAKIAVVTDSVACIPADLVKKYNIYVAPVNITWDRVSYRDGVDIQTSDFYKRLRTSKTLPTTSSAIQGEFIQIFEGLRGKVDGIVTIVLTGALGAAYNSALNAKELVGGVPNEVIDTRSAMMAEGFVVLEAAKVAAAGGTLEAVAQAARDTIPKLHVFYAMDTLEYLRRGGRVSLPKAVLAGWLKVKPIVAIKDGIIAPLDRVRTRSKVIGKLMEIMEQEMTGSGPLHVSIIHGDAPEAEIKQLQKAVTTKYQCTEMLITEITPVIGTHLGPGTLGLAFYRE